MTKITRHRGTIDATGARCIVVYRELDDNPERAVICYTDALPDIYAMSLSRVVDGVGQTHQDLFEVLTKERSPDGTDWLTTLHLLGKLRPFENNKITMNITSNANIRLSVLNEQIRDLKQETDTKENNVQKLAPTPPTAGDIDINPNNIAGQMIIEADKMQIEVNKMREVAYELRPELRPELTISPDFSVNLAEYTLTESLSLLRKAYKANNPK